MPRKYRPSLNRGQQRVQRERLSLLPEQPVEVRPPHTRHFDDVLDKVINKLGMARSLFRCELEQRWPELVGELNARHSRPGEFAYGVLRIRVAHPVMLQQMQQITASITEKLQATFPDKKIRSVRLEIDSGP